MPHRFPAQHEIAGESQSNVLSPVHSAHRIFRRAHQAFPERLNRVDNCVALITPAVDALCVAPVVTFSGCAAEATGDIAMIAAPEAFTPQRALYSPAPA